MASYECPGPPPTAALAGSVVNLSETFQVAVTAVAYPVQILKIERACVARYTASTQKPLPIPYTLTQYIGTTVSGGGGSITPRPFQGNASPASATCRYGTAASAYTTSSGAQTFTSTPLTFTGGTSSVLRSEDINSTPAVPFIPLAPVELDYQFPNDYIMQPGSTFFVAGIALNGSTPSTVGYFAFSTVNIYFQELHLARSA